MLIKDEKTIDELDKAGLFDEPPISNTMSLLHLRLNTQFQQWCNENIYGKSEEEILKAADDYHLRKAVISLVETNIEYYKQMEETGEDDDFEDELFIEIKDKEWEALLHDPEPLEKIAKNCTSRIDWEYDYALNGAIEYTARKVARETETKTCQKKEKDTDFEL